MKYITIIDSDNELSEDAIRDLKSTVFVGGKSAPYCFEITSIKQEPTSQEHLLDKIIEEIESEYEETDYWSIGTVDGILKIIDKYKAESEEENER